MTQTSSGIRLSPPPTTDRPRLRVSAPPRSGATQPLRWVRRVKLCALSGDLVLLSASVAIAALAVGDTMPDLVARLALPAVWVLVLAACGGYDVRLVAVDGPRVGPAFRAAAIVATGGIAWSYFTRDDLGRLFIVAVTAWGLVATVALRLLGRRLLARATTHGRCRYRTLVVGSASDLPGLRPWLAATQRQGLDVVGICIDDPSVGAVGDLCVLGQVEDVTAVAAIHDIDVVTVGPDSGLDGETLRRLAWSLETVGVELVVVPPLVGASTGRLRVRVLDHLTMLHVAQPRFADTGLALWETAQRLAATILVIVLLPVLLGIAAVVRVSSPGGALFRQVRVGRYGEQFTLLKFRTMVADAEQRLADIDRNDCGDGVLFKLRADPRVTRIGRLLRRTSLDELPQLFHVISGRMALVGPRPALPREVAAYEPDMRRRLLVKPGLTGLWQVSGRSELSWQDAVRLDLQYVDNRCPSLDLVILLRTFAAVVRSHGAY